MSTILSRIPSRHEERNSASLYSSVSQRTLFVSVPTNKVTKMTLILPVWNISERYALPYFRIIFGEIWTILQILYHFSFPIADLTLKQLG